MIDLGKITKNGRAIFLAYDQGMEHGPVDFDDKNVNPEEIIKIASNKNFTGLILQKGIAEKYYSNNSSVQNLPLILKLNGKTNLINEPDPYSPQLCEVSEALNLGASAVGYTIYIGSKYESKMFDEFADIVKEAHEHDIPVIGWMYIKGSGAKGKSDGELTAYGTRIGLEIGADIVKIKYPGSPEDLRWAVESAGKTKVVLSGGAKEDEKEFLKIAQIAIESGCIGMAVGRNIWQSNNPNEITNKLSSIIYT